MFAYDEQTVLHLVGLVYDAAVDGGLWPQFLEALADTVNGHFANISYLDHTSRFVEFAATARFDPAFGAEYRAYYSKLDPWARIARERGLFRTGLVDLGDRYLSPAELERTEFYTDLGRRFGFLGGLTAVIAASSTSISAISIAQRKAGSFREDERRLVEMLLPHLQRALALHQRLTDLQRTSDASLAAIDRMPFATMLVAADSRPSFVNAAATAVLQQRDGLELSRGQLVAGTAVQTRELQNLIDGAADCAKGHGIASGGTLTIGRPSLKRPYNVLVTPMRHQSEARVLFQDPGCAAVFVADPEAPSRIDRKLLEGSFDFTPAEAAIAALLAQGKTVAEIVASLRISEHTVRTHLKHLFAKTGVENQPQLVRLILTSTAGIR
jgi:DNA-binding CsgD family transcriptional regulator